MAKDDVLILARFGARPDKQFDDVAFFQAACGVEAQVAVDAGAARLDETAHLIPGLAGQSLAQQGGKCQTGLRGGKSECF